MWQTLKLQQSYTNNNDTDRMCKQIQITIMTRQNTDLILHLIQHLHIYIVGRASKAYQLYIELPQQLSKLNILPFIYLTMA